MELKAALEITDAKKKRTLAPKDEDQDHDLENANVHVAENVVVDRAHAIVLEDQDVIETISVVFFLVQSFEKNDKNNKLKKIEIK